jgi:hypothetical protein
MSKKYISYKKAAHEAKVTNSFIVVLNMEDLLPATKTKLDIHGTTRILVVTP